MNLSKTIIFRVDAHKGVGLGHITRCKALAEKFWHNGYRVVFAGAIDNSISTQLVKLKMEYQPISDKAGSRGDLERFLTMCHSSGANIVIVDHYDVKNQYCQCLMDEEYFVVSIHDTGMSTRASHMVINASLNAEKEQYEVSDDVILLLGINYLMLPEEYWDINDEKQISSDVKNILITMGANDQHDLTTRILPILNSMQGAFTITVVAGPYYSNHENIADQIKKMNKKVHLINTPSSLFPCIRECSIAISSAGQTLYQLAALGRPTIGISAEENQAGHLKELTKMEALIGLTYEKGEDFDRYFKDSIFKMMNDLSLRTRISETAAKIVDGQGAKRVFEKIVQVYANRDKPDSIQTVGVSL